MAEEVSVRELRDWAVRSMDTMPRGEALRLADLLLSDILGVGRADLIAYPDRFLVTEEANEFRSFVAKALAGVPVQYILGWSEFYGLRFEVSPAVLIPRPETEVLVDQVLTEIAHFDKPSILDVGTGSGCISVALAHERPDARVTAVDVSPASIRVAQRNAEWNGVRVLVMQSDLRDEGFNPSGGPFDVVVSNPPYVHPSEAESLQQNVIEHEPHVALFTTEDPLEYYRLLLARTVAQIRDGGALVVEVHSDRARQVESLMSGDGSVREVCVIEDLAGRERIVRGRVVR